MKIAICDDQKNALDHTYMQVSASCPQSEITAFLKIPDLFQALKAGEKFDVIFMDIEWEGEQKIGIDFASEIYNLSPKSKIIFVTGYPERYSQEIFLKVTNLCGFIVKPSDINIIEKHIAKIRNEAALESSRKLILTFNGAVTSIDPGDILYIESRARMVTIYVAGRTHSCYEKLVNLINRLPRQFIFSHKSFLVNMDKIRRIERERIVLVNNMEVPVSKYRYNEVRSSYLSYIESTM